MARLLARTPDIVTTAARARDARLARASFHGAKVTAAARWDGRRPLELAPLLRVCSLSDNIAARAQLPDQKGLERGRLERLANLNDLDRRPTEPTVLWSLKRLFPASARRLMGGLAPRLP